MRPEELPPPELKALLDQLPPPPTLGPMKGAVWARVASSVAAGPAAGVAAATGVATVKQALALVAAAVVCGAGGVIAGRTVFAREPRVIVHTEYVVSPAPPTAAPPTPTTLSTAVPEASAGPAARPAVTRRSTLSLAATGSSEERQLIDAARVALLKRDVAAAQRAIDSHRTAFPRGQLLEERLTLEVQVLMLQGKSAEAADAARRFLQRYPGSVFGPVVEAALEAAPE